MNLKEVVTYIKARYIQEEVLLRQFDYHQDQFYLKPNPKYLFRGEQKYPSTKSSYHRLIDNEPKLVSELTNFSLSLSTYLLQYLYPNISRSNSNYWPTINELGTYLQHYGFPVMFLDFTQNINIAAFFASHNNDSQSGRICILETSTLLDSNEYILKLSNSNAQRPKQQEAFSLRMFDDKPDLKNSDHFKTVWIDFDLAQTDVIEFSNPKLLSTKGDKISDLIISYLNNHKPTSKSLMLRLESLRNDLLVKKNWA